MPLGKKRAVIMAKGVVTDTTGPQGPIKRQVDLIKVFNTETTLEELEGYLAENGAASAQIVYESTGPEISRDKEAPGAQEED